ncbi:MAG: class III poly(R)-hydroxyalkanoic acid synthase subunit PhaC [Chloroflexaceae bacterium]|nr:class III poly(R)-hydroxyalkanoic acid synthase subunit PhaC [Chloroflexaceae bacterium]
MQSFPVPIQIRPEDAAQEVAELNQKLLKGVQTLSNLTHEDVQVGQTPKEAVYQEDKLVLYRYRRVVEESKLFKVPVLICYALVNRPNVADLQENRSLIRNLVNLGMDVYLMDWGYPSRADRWLTLDDYINGYINNCVDFIREQHGLDQINLLGICQGGSMSLCYASIYTEKIKNLVVMVAPVDFHAQGKKPGLIPHWGSNLDAALMVKAMGNISGDLMNFGFLMLQPFALMIQKYVDMIDIVEDEAQLLNFLRMEEWIFDSPDLAGEAYLQFVRDFFQDNRLIKGDLMIGDRRVNLSNVTMPVLNVFAEKDHLVPPPSSQALQKYVGSKDYTESPWPVGHIGMYVSRKAQEGLAPAIAEWLKARA